MKYYIRDYQKKKTIFKLKYKKKKISSIVSLCLSGDEKLYIKYRNGYIQVCESSKNRSVSILDGIGISDNKKQIKKFLKDREIK